MRFYCAKQGHRGRAWELHLPLVLGLALLLAGALAWLPASASAEPYLAVREGYKCSKCHVNKTGGNARTGYAKVYMATRMAANGTGGSDLGNGHLSPYLNISADLRQFVEHRKFHGEKSEPQTWQFGRASSCQSCHTSASGGGKLAEVYAQFEPLPGKASIVVSENFLPQPTTREAYGLLNFSMLNSYVKVGSFRMPTALRNTWDDPYIHAHLNNSPITNLVGEVSVRGNGMEIGMEPGPFSVSLSVTNPETVVDSNAQNTDKRVDLNVYAVGRYGMLGGMVYRDPYSADHERHYQAVYGGSSYGLLTGLVQLDKWQDRQISTAVNTDAESWFAELDLLVARGHNIKWQYEAIDPDLGVNNDRSERNSLIYEPFITPYLQLRGGVRRWEGPRELAGYNGVSVFFEVHLTY